MVELLPGVVRSSAVELGRISQQIEMRVDVGQATGEVVFDTGETADQLVALPRYLVEPSLDLCNRQLAVCCEIQQVLFLDVELINLGLELLAKESLGADFVSNNCFELPSDSLDELGAEPNALVVLFNGPLDAFDVGVRCIAEMLLNPTTEEVVVLGSVTAGGPLQDHAPDRAVF